LSYGIDRTSDIVVTFRQDSTRRKEKRKNIEEPRVPEHSSFINIGAM
jgi:hypothetical protein